MKRICVLLVIFMALLGAVNVNAQIINHGDDFLCKKNYSYSAAQLNSITYGNNMFVAVGENGAIKTSINGIEWVGIKPLTHKEPHLTKVLWNGKVFVAVGNSGKIILSKNGKDWAPVNSNCLPEENLSDVIWDGKQFVAIGNVTKVGSRHADVVKYGIVLKSSDGFNWSRKLINNPKMDTFNSIIHTGSGYYANSRYYSKDALNWSEVENNEAIYDCTTVRKLLLKVNKEAVYISYDGVKWIYKGKIQGISNIFELRRIVWTGKIFVGICENSTGEIVTSSDGVKWNRINDNKLRNLRSICWNGKQFIVNGSNAEVFLSSNGTKWTKYYSGIPENLNDIVFNGKRYVAVGGLDLEKGLTLSSTDGLHWTKNKTSLDSSLNSVIWDGKRFVATGGNSIFVSDDGISWSKATTQKYNFNDIVWNGKLYVAPIRSETFNSENIAYSKDGKEWILRKVGERELSSIKWNGNEFLTITGNKVWTSSDGVEWSSKDINIGIDIGNYTYKIGLIGSDFIIDPSDELFKSKDGINWTKFIPVELGRYGHNAVPMIIDSNFIRGHGSLGDKDYISPDGINWAVLDYYDEKITGIAYNSKDKKFVAVGREGTLILIEPKHEKLSPIDGSTNIFWSKYENKQYHFDDMPFNADMVSDDFNKEKDNLNSIAYNGKVYVSVGDNGVIRTSANSIKWITVSSGVKSKLNHVIWDNGKFTAVGEQGTILQSLDGYIWKDCSVSESAKLKKVIWDGKRFIVFADAGLVYINEGSEQWKSKKIGELIYSFIDAVFNGKKYVLSYGPGIYISDDLEDWKSVKVINEEKYYKYMYYNIMWDGKKFTALYSEYINIGQNTISYDPIKTGVVESYDGVNWKEQFETSYYDATISCGLSHQVDFIEDEGRIVGAEEDWIFGCHPGNFSWAEREAGKTKQINKLVVWNGSEFVLCGAGGSVYTSKDGLNWIDRTRGKEISGKDSNIIDIRNRDSRKIVWDGNKYIIYTLAGVFTSSDGIEWSDGASEKDKFETLGTDGTVILGKDVDWDKIGSAAVDKYSDFYVYKCSKGYIAVGGGYKNPLGYKSNKQGVIFLSNDGEGWVSVDPGVEGFLKRVVYNNGKYVAVGDNGIIITSKDGTKWEKQNSGIKNNLFDIATNGSIYVASGDGGIILTSKDGVKWTKAVENPSMYFYEVTWDGIAFRAAANLRRSTGYTASLLSSKDGMKWDATYIDSLYSAVFSCNKDTYVIMTGEENMERHSSYIVGR